MLRCMVAVPPTLPAALTGVALLRPRSIRWPEGSPPELGRSFAELIGGRSGLLGPFGVARLPRACRDARETPPLPLVRWLRPGDVPPHWPHALHQGPRLDR